MDEESVESSAQSMRRKEQKDEGYIDIDVDNHEAA